MRRKRAQAAGKVANEDIGRLKPGRKPKKVVPKAKAPAPLEEEIVIDPALLSSPSGQAGDTSRTTAAVAEDAVPSDDDTAYRHAHPSGTTLPYKRQQQFLLKGVNAERLCRDGLGLFHLQGISRLMRSVIPKGFESSSDHSI